MASYEEVLAALPRFRNDLLRQQQSEPLNVSSAFTARGAFAAFASPASNIHATGLGMRLRNGVYDPGEIVLKVFVFDKVSPEDLAGAGISNNWDGLPVDVESLPIQVIRENRESAPQAPAAPPAPVVPPKERFRDRHRPIIGGLSISPVDVRYVGTLGCFLRRPRANGEDIYALSNNHVLADVNALERGTRIVQPGPELNPLTPTSNVFATLSGFIPIQFPTTPDAPVVNRFDAAIALVTDKSLIETGKIFGIEKYDPSEVVPAVPGMRVIKAGRTTGVTRGRVSATDVDGVQVNYGTQQAPRLAVFDDTIEIVSIQDGKPFSLPGDSGSVILEEDTGHPVALLFAGDGVHTTACDLGRLCRRLRAWPV